jgi:hypothetical protein
VAPTDVFVSTPGRVLTGATAVVAALLVVSLWGDVPTADWLLAASLAALAVLAVWAVLGRPGVEVSDGTVVLRNVLRTVTIPWPTVRRAEVGWSLVVHTTAGPWTAWAAPRSSPTGRALRTRRAGGSVDREDRPFAAGHGVDRPLATGDGTARRRHAGTAEAVAAAIEDRLDALRRAGHLDDADRMVAEHGLRPTVTWHRTTVASAVGLVLVAVATRLV